jgi:hypothetical protein
MNSQMADVVFTDPPYNVKIDGNVCGKGAIRHREFAMASGEMTEGEFLGFLCTALGFLERSSKPGSVHFICMDWRHAGELLIAGKQNYDTLLELSTNGAQIRNHRALKLQLDVMVVTSELQSLAPRWKRRDDR